jgi:hypothetical protein
VIAGVSVTEIAATKGFSRSRVQLRIELAFLTPDIVEEIAAGHQPMGFTSEWVKRHKLAVIWAEQRETLAKLSPDHREKLVSKRMKYCDEPRDTCADISDSTELESRKMHSHSAQGLSNRDRRKIESESEGRFAADITEKYYLKQDRRFANLR